MEVDLPQGIFAEEFTSSQRLLSRLPSRELISSVHFTARKSPESLPSSYTQSHSISSYHHQSGAVITKIEDIFESIADCILEDKDELVIELKSRVKTKTILGEHSTKTGFDVDEDESERKEHSQQTQTRRVTFPSKSKREAWRFAALVRILELSHEALVSGNLTTKRDIYYRDPELFMRQAVVDRYVNDIAVTFGVNREALNVVAAAKGLVAGSFALTRRDKSTVDYALEPDGLLVPNPTDIESIRLYGARWVLVIEKEASFRTLATNKYWETSTAGKGILITAKGYPDIQTRKFLHILSSHHPEIPIYALADYDPDGIGIMSTYKYGSVRLSHESGVAVPSIQWLGIKSQDFLTQDKYVQGLLPLTCRDRRITVKMLEKEVCEKNGRDQDWRRELQLMLMTNTKAEIQILGNGEKLGEWLDKKLLKSSIS